MANSKKILVVGAGFAGATIGRILAENSYKVTIIDKRNHIGGNAYDYLNQRNERIHKYGPHLLHGNKDSQAVKFLSRFTSWVKYEHKVRALLSNNKTTPLPVNRTTLEDIYNIKLKDEKKTKEFLDKIRVIKLIPKNCDELFLSNVGEKLSNIFFRPYTKKMWGLDPKELKVGIGARLPVRTNIDDRYFTDSFQYLPINGYTFMFKNIIDHENICIKLNTEFEKSMLNDYFHSFLCIPIDSYFNYCYGELPYRSLIFINKEKRNLRLDAPQINFTDNSKFTRMSQWNLLPNCPNKNNYLNTITYEQPVDISLNKGEYYYPVQTPKSSEIYKKYKNLSDNYKNLTFCGRTGLFRYIDMIPAVTLHMKIAYDFLSENKKE